MKHQAKQKTVFFYCTILMLLVLPGIHAEETDSRYLGISLGSMFDQIDDKKSADHFYRPVSLNFDNTFGFQIRGGYVMNNYISAEAMLEYVFPFETDSSTEKVEIDVIHLALQSKIRYPQQGPIQPYGLIGLGIMNTQMNAEISFDGSNIQETEWGFSTKIGAGVDIYITHNIFSNLELSWTKGMGNVDHVQYPAFIVGGNYQF